MKGIQVLVVNAYDREKSTAVYQTYVGLVRSLLGKESLLVERAADNLGDYVFDWQHALLQERCKSIAKRFDKLDMVFVSGDCRTLPWDGRMHDLALLLHMCNFVKKPVVCTGSGAFHAVYALCTKGTSFDIINGPSGNALERLTSYGRYANGSEQHPSGWLDSETGDVYRYDPRSRSWSPSCCVGVNRLPAHGAPSKGVVKAPARKLASDSRRLNEQPAVQALDRGCDVVVVRSAVQQHYLLHKLPLPKFVMPLPAEWYLNGDGGLPHDGGMCVLADGSCGPVLATYDNCLLLAVEIAHGAAYGVTRQILKNFIRQQIVRMEGEDAAVTTASHFVDGLFGPGGNGEVSWVPPQPGRGKLAEPLASSLVPSALSCGPVKVGSLYSPRPAAAHDVVAQPGVGDHFDYTALLSPRGNTTLGKKVPVAQRRDRAVRTKRLDIFLATQGHPELQPLNKKAARLAKKMANRAVSPTGYDAQDSARAMFGEEHLRKPVKAPEELYVDNRQLRPPAIHFDRLKSASSACGGTRWASKKGGAAQAELALAADRDHTLGESGVDHRSRAQADKNKVRPASAKVRAGVEANFLPLQHPTRKVRVPELMDKKGNKIAVAPAAPASTAAAMAQSHSQSTLLVHVENAPTVPFTNHKKYQRMAAEEMEMERLHPRAPFKGTYSQPYRTDHEMAVFEYNELKRNFLAGMFRTQFGQASQIPLRSRGVIGGASAYPKNPAGMQGLKAADFALFTKEKRPEGEAEVHGANKWKNC